MVKIKVSLKSPIRLITIPKKAAPKSAIMILSLAAVPLYLFF